MKYKSEFEFAKNIAVKAGRYLEQQTNKAISSEIGKDIKLQLDKESEQIIVSELNDKFAHPILSEETGLVGSKESEAPIWIVDPIDGTMNYSRDIPFACVSIAFWSGKNPVFGIVYDFNRDELFSGYIGAGGWLNDQPIKPGIKKSESRSILATGIPVYMSTSEDKLSVLVKNIQIFKKIRMMGSAALSLAYVACGRFDAYYEESIKLWDVAAGLSLVKAVGVDVQFTFINNEYGMDVFVGNIKE